MSNVQYVYCDTNHTIIRLTYYVAIVSHEWFLLTVAIQWTKQPNFDCLFLYLGVNVVWI